MNRLLRYPCLFFCLALVFQGCGVPARKPAATLPAEPTLQDLQAAAEKAGSRLSLPTIPETPGQVKEMADAMLKFIQEEGDKLASQDRGKLTWDSTFGSLDRIGYQVDLMFSEIQIAENASPNKEVRDVATEEGKKISDALVAFEYREDIYQVVKAFADTRPPLQGEEKKMFDEVLLDFKRAGFDQPAEKRAELEALFKEMNRLEMEFRKNISDAVLKLSFSRGELEGLPESFFTNKEVQKGSDRFEINVNVTWQYLTLMDNAKSEEVRKKVQVARYQLVQKTNMPLLARIVSLRAKLARRLGYATWADYKTEVLMTKSGAKVKQFLSDLTLGLQPKFQEELEILRGLKIEETGNTDAELRHWDTRYYQNQLKQKQYNIDEEALRNYFPYEKVLVGMFGVYEDLFGIQIRRLENPSAWAPGVELYGVIDTETQTPLGLFYLDMFPREGKYNHFAQFGIISGRQMEEGYYQRPTVALICNFPAPQEDLPSLLTFDQVETVFHEFGHGMHSILTMAKFYKHSGTSVPRDFVETPSQVLEYWVKEKAVLDRFAADYRDPSQKIPQEILDQLEQAQLATMGMHYRRQMAFASLDMALHTATQNLTEQQVLQITNGILDDVFLPVPDDTSFVASFGHLMGYDAGYYGYAWADVIAADLASSFKHSKNGGFMDLQMGLKLRKEIFEKGDSRDINESIRAFLGREPSEEPFFEKLGVKRPDPKVSPGSKP